MADIKLKDTITKVFTKKSGKNTAKTVLDFFRWKNKDVPPVDYKTAKIFWGTKNLESPEDKTLDAYGQLKEKNEKIVPEKEKKQKEKRKKEKRIYYVPVTYDMFGMIPVKAESLKKAYDIIRDNSDVVPLPVKPKYIDGSLVVTEGVSIERNEDIAVIELRETKI